MGFREIAAGSLPAYSLGGYIAAWRRARWTTKTGHGFLVWTFTVKGSMISTRSIGAKDVEPRSLLAGLARRSRLNLTDSALKSSPLWNLTPRRSLISQTVGATSFGISTASAGTIFRSGPRSTSDSKICAPTFEAGCSCWCIMSSVVGSTPCAITTLPSGAASRAAHGRDRVLGAEEDALGVHRHHLVPLRDGALLDRHLGDHDGRVVDQDVEPAVAIQRGLHRRSPVRLAGHVQVEVDGVAAAGPDGPLDLLALVVPDVPEHDSGALAREGLRLRRALPPGPAADQRDLPVKLAHSPGSYRGRLGMSECKT